MSEKRYDLQGNELVKVGGKWIQKTLTDGSDASDRFIRASEKYIKDKRKERFKNQN